MPEVIDKEIEKVKKQSQIPKKIYVGIGLYNEIKNEQFEPFAANQEASAIPKEDPTEYKGIKLHVVEDEYPDYLSIET